MTDEHISAHILSKVPGIGAQKMLLLLAYFSSYSKVLSATSKQLQSTGLSKKLADTLRHEIKDVSKQVEKEKLEENQISVILQSDKCFPKSLSDTNNRIPLLYVRGNKDILDMPSIAIVGSRNFSPYGKQAATRLSLDLAQAGVNIISGLALGIDALAHNGALQANSINKNAGKTIAVLGGGIDDATIAPRTHLSLAQNILNSGGTIISTYPPYTAPSKGTFPARNAVMASLSSATLVIEAEKNSGTLITAQLAHDHGKTIFAVPGSIFASQSVGTHDLLATGKAKIACQANDILSTLNIQCSQKQEINTKKNLSDPDTKKIFAILQQNSTGLPIDKIIRLTKLKDSTVTQTLVIMEIDGIVIHLGGGIYSIA